jgi:hypothetical protein
VTLDKRHSTGKTVSTISAKLSDDDARKLEEVCAALLIDKSDAIRQGIVNYGLLNS